MADLAHLQAVAATPPDGLVWTETGDRLHIRRLLTDLTRCGKQVGWPATRDDGSAVCGTCLAAVDRDGRSYG